MFSFKLVQTAVQIPESVRFAVRISTVVDEQTRFVLFTAKTHDKGVHADVIAEDVVKRQVQGTRQMQKHLKRFFFCVRVWTHKCLLSWGLVRHICSAHHRCVDDVGSHTCGDLHIVLTIL
jgi:hypothetical protein